MSLCVLLNRAGASLVNLLFLPTSNLLGGQAALFSLYAAITAVITVVAYFTAIETKGKTLEEISAQRATRALARRLKVFGLRTKSPDLLTWLGPLWCLHMGPVHGFEPDPQHRKSGIPW